MNDHDYSIEDKYMKECIHSEWIKICAWCGKVLEDNQIEREANYPFPDTTSSNRTKYVVFPALVL